MKRVLLFVATTVLLSTITFAQDTVKHSFSTVKYKIEDTTVMIQRNWSEGGFGIGLSFGMCDGLPFDFSLGGFLRGFTPQSEKWAIGFNMNIEGNNLMVGSTGYRKETHYTITSWRYAIDFSAMYRPIKGFSMVYGIGLNMGMINGISYSIGVDTLHLGTTIYYNYKQVKSLDDYVIGELGLDLFTEIRWHPSNGTTIGLHVGYFNNLIPQTITVNNEDVSFPTHHYNVQFVFGVNVDEVIKKTWKGKTYSVFKAKTEQLQ